MIPATHGLSGLRGCDLVIVPGRADPPAEVPPAQRLLETTDLPVHRVAERSGLGTAANLRRLRAELGVAPDAYRRTFRVPSAGVATAP